MQLGENLVKVLSKTFLWKTDASLLGKATKESTRFLGQQEVPYNEVNWAHAEKGRDGRRNRWTEVDEAE